jgi:hypothetical protein
MCLIPLTQGKFALIDQDDFERVSKFKWYYNGYEQNKGYARRNIRVSKTRRTALLLHREILGITDSSIIIDHINGDRLDNRKVNLRIANALINAQNSSVRKHSSIYIGVGFYKKLKKWRSRITVNKKLINIGLYETQEEARDARKFFIEENQLVNFRKEG